MSDNREIPEGTEPPIPNTVILGWGGDFIIPPGGFSGWMSSDNGLSWLEGAGLRGVDQDSLYAAPFLSDVNTLNAPSLETSLGLAPGSFGNFIKGMDEKAIRESEVHFSNLRAKINENQPHHLTNPDGSKGAKVIHTLREPDALDREFAELKRENPMMIITADGTFPIDDFVFDHPHTLGLQEELEGLRTLYGETLKRESENYAKCVAADERAQDKDEAIRTIIKNWQRRMKSPNLSQQYRNGIESCAAELDAALSLAKRKEVKP